jgi:predicted amidohydrolase
MITQLPSGSPWWSARAELDRRAPALVGVLAAAVAVVLLAVRDPAARSRSAAHVRQLRLRARLGLVRVHVIQVSYGDDESLPDRVDRVAALVRAQSGADLVVLPELWPNGGFAYDTWQAGAQPLDGHVVTELRAATRDLGATVHMGSFVERDEADRLFNTSVLLAATGELLTTYRKVHLFGFGEGEPALMTPGDGPVVHETLGLATCYDLRFPRCSGAARRRRRDRADAGRLAGQAGAPLAAAGAGARGGEPVLRGGLQHRRHPCRGADGRALAGRRPLGRGAGRGRRRRGGAGGRPRPAYVAKTRAAFPVLADRRL